MESDLISLRMLVVAAAPSQRDLWHEGAAMAFVPIEFAAEAAAAAVRALKKGDIDICVVDAALSDDDKGAVAVAARAACPAPVLFA